MSSAVLTGSSVDRRSGRLAPALPALAAGRFVQGAAAAMMMPASMLCSAAPSLAGSTAAVLVGEVWPRPQPGAKERSLVTVAALTTSGKTDQSCSHCSARSRTASYAGWPEGDVRQGGLQAALPRQQRVKGHQPCEEPSSTGRRTCASSGATTPPSSSRPTPSSGSRPPASAAPTCGPIAGSKP